MQRLKQSSLRGNLRKTFLTVQAVGQWNRRLGVLEAPSNRGWIASVLDGADTANSALWQGVRILFSPVKYLTILPTTHTASVLGKARQVCQGNEKTTTKAGLTLDVKAPEVPKPAPSSKW